MGFLWGENEDYSILVIAGRPMKIALTGDSEPSPVWSLQVRTPPWAVSAHNTDEQGPGTLDIP